MEKITEERFMTGSNFLNRMSHDIRTPLNAVIGYSSLLEEKADNPDVVKEYADKIRMSGHTLLTLINDFLDMSRIESGNARIAYEDFDLFQAMEEVKADIKPQSDKKKQHFSSSINIDDKAYMGAMFRGDRNKLCRILINLLSNAVKYAPENGKIQFETDIGADGHIVFYVRDNGIGISDEFINKIFEPFAREENEKNQFIQGSGLGMSIVKEIVEMMNGHIEVKSEQNKGTEVTVQIRLEPVTQREDTYEPVEYEKGRRLDGMSFLIAEDNEIHGEIISEMLAVKGAESNIAANGNEVVERFVNSDSGHYDAILMDIQMPFMNGYDAAKAIRTSEKQEGRDIIIIAMTANALEDDVQMAFEAGMNGHIAKPVDMEAFTNMVLTLKKNTRS